ncbi:MAG: DotI/IcmL family type IV secretion protein [Gammaproteobacteria bacterium]
MQWILSIALILSVVAGVLIYENYTHSKRMLRARPYALMPERDKKTNEIILDAATGQPQIKQQYLITLSRPVITTSALLDWAREAAVMCYNYDFFNANAQITKNIRLYFTDDGGAMFRKAIASDLKTVEAKSIIVTAIARGVPILLQQGYLLGNWIWKVQVPLKVSYQSASEVMGQNVLVTMMIMNIPTTTNPKAIGITQFFSQRG